ncbi:uncharacterized protein LOC124368214 [Homalodisca vitripennis]|uniref:uncharacterized protein LOC124368214 n=1 Tax=Homalodisca vitripennis TaxID=197043 RepID=UPI001EE9C1DC|nr:uncharacterized protein LOC124368214 [Homalodisca vitripennis]
MKLLPGFTLFYDASTSSQIEDNSFMALIDSFKRYKFGQLEVVNEDSNHWRKRCQLKFRDKILAEGEDLVDAQAQANATLDLLNRLKAFSFTIKANQDYFCNGKVPCFMENPGLKINNEFRIIKYSEVLMIPTIIKEFCEKPTFQELIFGADFPWETKMQISRYVSYRGLIHRLFTSSDDSVDPTHMAVYHPIDLSELKAYLLDNPGENMKYRLKPPEKFPFHRSISENRTDMKIPTEGVTPTLSTSDHSTDKKRKREEDSVGEVKVKKLKAAPPDFITDEKLPGLVLFIGVMKNSMIKSNLMQILYDSFAASKYGRLYMNLIDEDMGGDVWSRCVLKIETMVLAEVVREDKVRASLDASRLLFDHLRRFCFTVQAKQSYYRDGNGLPRCFTQQYLFKDQKALGEVIKELTFRSSKALNSGLEIVYRIGFSDIDKRKMIAEVDKLNFSYRSLNHQNIPAIAIYQSPSPTMLKYKLMKTGGDSDKYQLIEPGGEIYFPGDELFFPADKSISSTKSSTQEKNLPLNVKKEENIAEVISELDTTSQVPSSTAEETQDSDPTKKADFFWAPKELLPKVAKSLFMCKLVKSDSTTESDPCALLESTISLISNLVFKYITSVTNNNQHQVIVGLELDNRHLKLGTGVARNIQNAKLIAAHKSVHMLQEHCKVIVPNFHYFAEGGIPQFIRNSSPRLTNVYEIASKGSDQPGFYSMLQRFIDNRQ